MAKTKIKKAPTIKDERTFHNIALVLMSLLALYCVIPFFLMLAVSFSSEASLIQGYRFWPAEFSISAYSYLWIKRLTIARAYGITILVTVVGTAANLVLTSLFAYPLSRRDFKPRNIFAFILFFTMLFNGGLTASYIVWTRLFHIKDTLWAYLLPGALMGGMNVLLVRNYYNVNIPYSIIEAARIDGANDMRIYAGIMVPLSKPVMTTIGLFAALGYWNNWTNGLYYISDPKLYSIQVYLKKLMDSISFLKTSDLANESAKLALQSLPTESARMAIAIIAILPILLVYPFIQKELIKGMVVGGVKG
ncbi:MAG: carbohydrate ABC transporter permease [Oscillospiraceae bacterium]|nr:carbohydrate ABC transporter permease [Oscillospiraceae bacterium]